MVMNGDVTAGSWVLHSVWKRLIFFSFQLEPVTIVTATLRYALVWKEASSLFDDMVEVEGWNNKPMVILDPVNDLTTKACRLWSEQRTTTHYLVVCAPYYLSVCIWQYNAVAQAKGQIRHHGFCRSPFRCLTLVYHSPCHPAIDV